MARRRETEPSSTGFSLWILIWLGLMKTHRLKSVLLKIATHLFRGVRGGGRTYSFGEGFFFRGDADLLNHFVVCPQLHGSVRADNGFGVGFWVGDSDVVEDGV